MATEKILFEPIGNIAASFIVTSFTATIAAYLVSWLGHGIAVYNDLVII